MPGKRRLHLFASDQSRLPLLEKSDLSGEVRALYENVLRREGVVSNLFKVLSHAPRLAQGLTNFLNDLTTDGALPGWYKELIAARIAILQRCAYSHASHTAFARQKGATEGQIAALQFYEQGPFTGREKRGFHFADQIHRGPDHVDESLFSSVKQYFTAAEIVELATTASVAECSTRLIAALRVPVTPAARKPSIVK